MGVLVASGSAGSAVTSAERDPDASSADGGVAGIRTSSRPAAPWHSKQEQVQPRPVAQRSVLTPQDAAPKYGIPATALDAYRRAEAVSARTAPGCHLDWAMLAGIGKVESGHANDGDLAANGDLLNEIYGPALDGSPNRAAIRDGAGWMRAAGPMQFLPSTWDKWGADGNADGRADPQNMYDSALATGRYLCGAGRNLHDGVDLQQAILTYNHSADYVDLVLSWARTYHNGGGPIPDRPGSVAENSRASGGAPQSPDVVAPEQPPASEPPPAPTPSPRPQPPEDGGSDEPPAPARPAPEPPKKPLLPEPVHNVLPPPVRDQLRPVEDGLARTIHSPLSMLTPKHER
ncbi:lytic transglycosylase domain-containing protein, partial [Saccharopolyspora sp. HNM0986]|uniref:lytic transglycosylase domain-containing protein n=1 Tax=Saccharopolyspora galaxeae TaxID=2781241 RepID=UPI00190BF23B